MVLLGGNFSITEDVRSNKVIDQYDKASVGSLPCLRLIILFGPASVGQKSKINTACCIDNCQQDNSFLR